jgi:hypothetical protein
MIKMYCNCMIPCDATAPRTFMNYMVVVMLLGLISLDASICSAFQIATDNHNDGVRRWSTKALSSFSPLLMSHSNTGNNDIEFYVGNESCKRPIIASRRSIIVSSIALCVGFVTQGTMIANADVSDGNALPQGAQQFARTIKLKTDLKV